MAWAEMAARRRGVDNGAEGVAVSRPQKIPKAVGMTSVFVSYARENQEAVKSLALDLGELDYQVWFDNELTGGQTWWDQLLAKIRECDRFAFGLSPESLDSQACKLERTYALNLGKSILPILIADDVPTDLLPTDLAQVHFVDYRAADKRALISLLKAIKRLPLPRPLPSPLPEPPAAPVSYLGSLRERVESAGQLSSQEQAELLLTLKRGLKDAKGKVGALTLLKQMRNRQDLYAWIGEEIDELVASAAVSQTESVVQRAIGEQRGSERELIPKRNSLRPPGRPPRAMRLPLSPPPTSGTIEVRIPEIGDATEAQVTKIIVKPGDLVRLDQALIEVETDKVVLEVPSPCAGTVKEILVRVGDKVATDGSLLVLEKTDWSKALDQHRQAAAQGDRDAQHVLGTTRVLVWRRTMRKRRSGIAWRPRAVTRKRSITSASCMPSGAGRQRTS